MWVNDRPAASVVNPAPTSIDIMANDDVRQIAEQSVGEHPSKTNSGAIASSYVPQLSSQPQSTHSTLERVVDNNTSAFVSQNTNVLPNTMLSSTVAINSHKPDPNRSSPNAASMQQQSNKDVTRVVKILKQNEPLVISNCLSVTILCIRNLI